MTVSVRGIGWVTATGYGSVRLGRTDQFAAGESFRSLAKLGLFSQPFKNFGRLDTASRLTVSAVALALQDAGIGYSPYAKQETGIIATSSNGSLDSDLQYYKDFVDNGRTLSRANLFIYTLPSSVLGEAAIYFGLTGPLLFTADVDPACTGFLDTAEEMVAAGEAVRMLAGMIAGETALYLVVDNSAGPLCSLADARSIISSSGAVSDMVLQFKSLKSGKA